jgi:hypothetical protein
LEAAAIISTALTGFQDRLGNNVFKQIIERKGWKNLECFINLNIREKKFRLIGIIDGMEIDVNVTYKERLEHKQEIPEPIINLILDYFYKHYRYRYSSYIVDMEYRLNRRYATLPDKERQRLIERYRKKNREKNIRNFKRANAYW